MAKDRPKPKTALPKPPAERTPFERFEALARRVLTAGKPARPGTPKPG